MDKFYGYREKDVRGLADFIKNRKGQSLSKVFENYGNYSGKQKVQLETFITLSLKKV